MEPKGQPNEQMEEVVLQPTQPKLVSFLPTTSKLGLFLSKPDFQTQPNQNHSFYF